MIDKPWTLKVEFTRGCNLSCRFCPIHADPAAYAEHTFLEPALLEPFLREYALFKPDTRVELTLRGEPTLNPRTEELLCLFRRHLPLSQVSMFTNGVRLLKDKQLAINLLKAGVNILNIDCYNGTYERFHALMSELSASHPWFAVTDFRAFSAYMRHPHGHELKVVNLVPDIGAADRLVAVRVLHNNAGNASAAVLQERWGIAPLQAPLVKRCAQPFREFVLYLDGSVVLCCHDWKAESVIGRFPEQSVESIWYGPTHVAAMTALYDKDRAAVPCNKCDYSGGFRTGLLKDPRA